MNKQSEELMLSVHMITYKQELYIKQAVEGVLMQETNFEFDLILCDDCSPDTTPQIVQDIIDNHPKGYRIKYFRQEKNIGMQANGLFALSNCLGKYIAFCEGDDYWIDPLKLQKQVAVLEFNKGIGLVYTGVKHFDQNTSKFIEIAPRFVNNKEELIPSILKSKFIEFPTTVFKKSVLEKAVNIIRKELENAVIGDTRIILEVAFNSEIHFLNNVTTVYRIVDGSASHPKEIDKFIFALKDSYLCRKSFVERNKLNTVWLSDSICNTNRGLINNAFVAKKYSDTIKFLQNILILDVFRYCSWNVFRKKMKMDIWLKLVLALLGIGFLRQKLR